MDSETKDILTEIRTAIDQGNVPDYETRLRDEVAMRLYVAASQSPDFWASTGGTEMNDAARCSLDSADTFMAERARRRSS